ncbi:MAG: DUF3047 domain-containing protein [Nitrospiria bacterium]
MAPSFRFILIFLFLFSGVELSSGQEVPVPIIPDTGSPTPTGWKLQMWHGNHPGIQVEPEKETETLHLISNKNSFGLYHEVTVDLHKTPLLKWEWKTVRLPQGGDVRNRSTDDQAAQIYVAFPHFPAFVNTDLVGYIWETLAPKGTAVTSTKSSKTRYFVLEQGTPHLNEWISESRNVYEDYLKLFGEEPGRVGGVSVMIDSDDTASSAESYFRNIRFVPATGG